MTGTGKSTGSAAFTRGTGKREGWKGHGKPGEAFNPGEMLVPLIKAEGAAALFAWLFYRSIPAFVLLQPLAVCLQRNFRRKERKRREQKLGGQFKDGLLAMAASLRAGHSAENAFEDAAGELAFLYGPEERITREFQRVTARTKMNVPLEQAVLELAARCSLPDIQTFSEVFLAARRTGGELGRIILDTAQTLAGRLEVREEIDTMLRGKQYEQKIMRAVPPLLLIYMDFTSPGFFSVLYETLLGRGIMTGCMGVYLAALYLAERISDIQV